MSFDISTPATSANTALVGDNFGLGSWFEPSAVYVGPAIPNASATTDWGNVFSGLASGVSSLGNAAANIIHATNTPNTPLPIFDSLTGIQVRPTASNPMTIRSNLAGAVGATASSVGNTLLSVFYQFMPVLVIGVLLWVAVKFFKRK